MVIFNGKIDGKSNEVKYITTHIATVILVMVHDHSGGLAGFGGRDVSNLSSSCFS